MLPLEEYDHHKQPYDSVHPSASTKAKVMTVLFVVFSVLVIAGTSTYTVMTSPLPEGFVYLSDINKDIQQDIRAYAYFHPTCILTTEAAKALSEANQELMETTNYVFKVYDCYRPNRTQASFWRWKNLNDTTQQQQFFPGLLPAALYEKGYITNSSRHSGGSTVAVTIAFKASDSPKPTNITQGPCNTEKRQRDNTLDMGTNFDCFHPASQTFANTNLSVDQKANRQTLLEMMKKHNFFQQTGDPWWRFTLIDEPHFKTSFDFVVQ